MQEKRGVILLIVLCHMIGTVSIGARKVQKLITPAILLVKATKKYPMPKAI